MALADLVALTKKSFMKTRPESEVKFILASEEPPPVGMPVNNPLLEFILDQRFLTLGRFYLAYGKKGAAKTSIFYEFVKIFQKAGGDAVWIETENAADLKYAAKQGVDLSRLMIHHPSSLEEALTLAEGYIRNMPKAYPDGDTPVLIALDSVAVGTDYETMATHSITDVQPGLHARLLSRFYREMAGPLGRERCLMLVLNQLKNKIGGFGYGEDAQDALLGGEAQFFASTYHWKFHKIEEFMDTDPISGAERKVGSKHKIQCKRNKLGREGKGQEIEVDLYIDGGMDFWCPLVRKLGKDYGNLVTKSGGFYYWKPVGTAYFTTGPDGVQVNSTIDPEQAFREDELAVVLANSPEACDLIRRDFGIPDLPPPEVVEQIEKERKSKRAKKAKGLNDE